MRGLGRTLGVVVVLLVACDDDDDTVVEPIGADFDVSLMSGNEVPPCEAAADGATGHATVSIADDGSSVTVESVTWSGLSGPATLAHIHFGSATEAGPVALDFGIAPASPFGRTFTAADYTAGDGLPASFADLVEEMRAGQTYVNVHTEACPAGEIRGQLL